MANFSLKCPHCLTASAGFSVTHQWQSRIASNYNFLVGVCGICYNGIIVHSLDTGSSIHGSLTGKPEVYPGTRYKILETWPSLNIDIPLGVPENIARFYEQGLINLAGQQWDAAGAMFRKTLDIATKKLNPEKINKTLFQRINLLVENDILTPAMGEWSHEIRLDGNDAVHDDEPETQGDASASQVFTEAFLRYAFTLPSMVEENRKKGTPKTKEA